jgi:hypothetical protein
MANFSALKGYCSNKPMASTFTGHGRINLETLKVEDAIVFQMAEIAVSRDLLRRILEIITESPTEADWAMLSPQAEAMTVEPDGRGASVVSLDGSTRRALADTLGHRAGSAGQPDSWPCSEVVAEVILLANTSG